MPGKENDIPGRKERKMKRISKKSDAGIELVGNDGSGNDGSGNNGSDHYEA